MWRFGAIRINKSGMRTTADRQNLTLIRARFDEKAGIRFLLAADYLGQQEAPFCLGPSIINSIPFTQHKLS